ncbi:MAG: autotransporter outer membrane beta-barrel domain-containing protein [Gammaproteobacteria bacterium]|nr:autotransporter outer membrane beta-barrel domain-containing protein [Gammaproteobacteria bacterium]
MDRDYPAQQANPAYCRRLRRAVSAAFLVAIAAAAPIALAQIDEVRFLSTAQTYSPAGTPDEIKIGVDFSVPVSVTGAPVFNLMVGTDRHSMRYVDGSGSTTLRFAYTVRKGDLDEDGVGFPENALTGGTIRRNDSNEIVDRSYPALARDADHTVDGVAPRAVSLQVTSNPMGHGTYAPGEVIALTLEFDEGVAPDRTDDSLIIDLDGTEKTLARGAVDGATLHFTYTVMEGDLDSNGFAVPSARFVVADAHGNVEERSTPAVRSPQRVDGVQPTVVRTAIVSDPGTDRTYGEGDAIVVEVAFSELVVVATDSTFTLLIGPDESRTALYLSGDGTNRVRYRYEVVAGDKDEDGISYEADALTGSIVDRVGNVLVGDVAAVTAQTGHRVETGVDNEPPVVTGVSVTSSPDRADTYAIGQDVEVTVEFNEPVVVEPPTAPTLELAIGNATKRADLVEPTTDAPAAALRFRYTIVAGDVDADGIAAGPIAESLVGGIIVDPSGNTAIRDFAALPAQRRHKVDGVVPAVTGVAITSDAGPDSTYAVGDEIEVQVDFSERVVADHAPELVLNLSIGEAMSPAHLAAGERTASLTFRYRVVEGDVDADGISIASTALTGGSVQDLPGNNTEPGQPDLALAAQPAHKVDAAATAGAMVEVLSSPGSDRTYALGDLIEVQVQFAEPVVVSGRLELILSLGSNDTPSSNLKRRATLVRQTARHLTFDYRVQEGDLDLDGLGVDAHALVGGTVVDAFGNPARLLEPFIDDGDTPRHRVDGIGPVVEGIEIVSDGGDDDTYGLGEDIDIDVTFSEVVHTYQIRTFLLLQIGPQARQAGFVDGSGTPTLRFRYTVVSSDRDDDGISVRGRALSCDREEEPCIIDNAGNEVQEPIVGLAAQPRHKVDGRQAEPRLSIVSEPSSGDTYGAGEPIEIQIDFPAPVYVTDDPELLVLVGGVQNAASFIDGSGTRSLLFRYTVRAGDRDDDGISIGPGPNALRGGRIVDANDRLVSRTFAGLEPAAGHRVDGNAPTVTTARIVTQGEYGLGDEIRVQVTFGERVHVRDASDLGLILAIGQHSRLAGYTEGSGTPTLEFVYRVAAEDRDTDGVSIGPDAVVGGVIEDDAGNDWDEADRRIPAVPADDTQTVNPDIDNRPPKVTVVDFVSRPADTYRTDEIIRVEVRFDEEVHVSGEPTLELSIGPVTRQAAFATGSGTASVEFRYTVQADDVDSDGISIGPGPASLSGGTIADDAGNPVDRMFRGLAAEGNPKVNAHRSTASVRGIQIVSSPGGNAYRAGETVEVEVEFTDVVRVDGQPVIVLDFGGANDHDAAYASGSRTDTLLFRYTVQPGDVAAEGIGFGPNALRGGTIANAAGVPAGRAHSALPANNAHRVDARAAEITEVALGDSHDGYRAGQTVRLTVTFDEHAFVTGTPVVALAVGAATRHAVYEDGSGTEELTFGYVVRPDDIDEDGISVPANGLTGGEITDEAGNPVDRRFRALPADPGHRVLGDSDTPVVASIEVVGPPSGDTFILDDRIEVRVVFSEAVVVAGSPAIDLEIGATIRPAAYVLGSRTDTLVFRYRTVAGDEDDDGISIPADALPAGAITDVAGNPADLGLGAVRTRFRFNVDAVVPVIEDVTIVPPESGGAFVLGDQIDVRVVFSEAVTVDGQPTVELRIGAETRRAQFATGSGTHTLVFRYQVAVGDEDEDGVSIDANALSGGAIADVPGNPARRAFDAVPADDGFRVVVVPGVDSVEIVSDAGSDSTYVPGDVVEVQVTFSGPVHVTGEPVLTLSIGANSRLAAFASGSGTTALLFSYAVVEGDHDEDGISVPANGLTGGEITDEAGNLVDRDFRALPADPGHKVEDSTPAVVASIEVVGPASGDTFILDDRIEVRVVFSEAVVVLGSPTIDLEIGATVRTAAYVLGSRTDTLVFHYRVVAGDEDDDGVSIPADALPAGSITDVAGNPADLALGAVRTRFRFNVDGVVPVIDDVTIVPPESGGTFVLGDQIEVLVVFTEAVTATGEPVVELTIGAEARRAQFAGGAGTDTLAFRYRVAAGDEDEDGVSIESDTLTGGTIADVPGNLARRTFDAVPADDRFKVDAVVPGVDSVEIVSDAGSDLTYIPGDVVEVQATFTDAVHVTGEPVLTLSIGANSRPAAFASGSGTSDLLFSYTVVEGDYDEDGISIAANAISGGMIDDDSGNPVDRSFAAVGAQSDHRVGAETSLQFASLALRIGGQHPPIDLAGALAEVGIRYPGTFAATSDNPAVATATTTGASLTVTPVSEGTANITIMATRAPITLFLPVTVQASEAETAVLRSALAAVGRGLLGSAADMIGARLELAGMPVAQGVRANYAGTATMPPAGHRAGFGASASHLDWGMFTMPGGFVDHGTGAPASSRPFRPASFAFPLAGITSPTTSWGVWGAAGYQAFEGKPQAGSHDGNLTSFHLGADAHADGWVAGASVSRSQADVNYAFDGDAVGAGTLDTTLTALHPYVQWRPGPGTTVWTILGFGAGEATVEREGRTAEGEPATLSMRLGLAGLRMDLGRPAGFALALRGDAGLVQLETEDGLRAVDGLSVHAQRVRAGIEASRPMATVDGIFSPFLEIGARWDGGDGEAGGGIEIAGGVRYRGSSGGVEVKARTLAMHGAEGVAEHGIAATAFIEPGPRGTGLRLSLTPRWGAPESRDVFWQSDYTMRGMRPGAPRRHWMLDAQVGYGLALRGRPGRLEPFSAIAGSPGTDSRGRVGVRYEAGGGHGVSRYEVSTERVEGVGRVDHRLLLVAEARF